MDSYDRLWTARKLFEDIAEDTFAPDELRLKALTDAGNSYDEVGRYLDALEMYDRALRLDPSFAMALGNRGMALFYVSSLMGQYGSDSMGEAADCLDAALNDHDGLLEHGGQVAVKRFQDIRSMILGFEERQGDSSRIPRLSC